MLSKLYQIERAQLFSWVEPPLSYPLQVILRVHLKKRSPILCLINLSTTLALSIVGPTIANMNSKSVNFIKRGK